ncbi:PREDICTED: uncharacterized protein LOC107185585 isoform X1 [Dufourea novaeangliae]|uniref:uncharacterized protein LOC107185585 isoform X1 n=1 Tax=Dufourea novaeangliae TaxID=178035 RepID=UPI000766ED45|nr:PREDICTED: uncharacterized protein LOC107185585 isoform X1 [Dufourea novaeangliae]XP_015428786.1 PREDICTED: uncharacterized protein LOC107185585 isoform X1 [Dufourea novaeangliae]XP_015428787.1 PREDICTED: uncharacterized protein LOC107185585 isoform X1 [Dufourea novaeangliae]
MPQYFAKPDGEDPLGKIQACLYPCIKLSMLASVHDVLLRSNCKTFAHAGQRVAFWMVPSAVVGTIFPSIVYMSTRLRGKDDSINHAMGALSILPILQRWFHIPFPLSLNIAVIAVFCAVINKEFRNGIDDNMDTLDWSPGKLHQHHRSCDH